MFRAFFASLLITLWATLATAQQAVWVQVEAQPTLTTAQDRARAYSQITENVSGYYIGSGWYGIVLGPYSRNDADEVLRRLRNQGLIPRDSFIALGGNFRQQFWPVGVGAQTTAQPLPGTTTNTTDTVTAPIAEPDPVIPAEETRREARASEALLDRAAREELQIAMKWAGTYTGAIDGAYGRGTRGAMEAWQIANNYEPTGVLTTKQRAALLASYNAVLDGMDLQLVRDDASGIQILVPTGVVEFTEYEPPFVRFDATGAVKAQVLFISQAGDQNRLFGLYEILQTLEIVPPEGDRNRNNNSFTLEGIGNGIHSYTTARLRDGQIKGFSLIWPAGDEQRRTRVLQEMIDSFETIDGVLDPAISTPGEDQAIDLVSGLAVRKPKLSRSGFYIDEAGTVLTTAEAVAECSTITLDDNHEVKVIHRDDALGIAVLRPDTRLAPLGVATFQTATPRLQAEIAVAGYPYGGILVSPSLTFGRLADIRGLNGEEAIKRLALTAQPGDAGGPVFDNGGAVLGMLLPRNTNSSQVLPPEVSFSVDSDEILASLSAANIAATTTDSIAYMAPEILTMRAADMTVLVSCW